jgi:hypothetical protein
MKDAKRLLEILNEPANYGLMPMWRSALRAVPERFKTPIKLRFGYLDDKPQTGEGVLNRLGISLQSFWLAIYLHLVETTPAIFGSYDSEEARISEMSSLREREIAAVEALQSELDILRSLGEGDANQAERLIHAWRNQQNRPKRAA